MMWHHVEEEEAHWIPPVITEVSQNVIAIFQNTKTRKEREKKGITRIFLIQVESGEWIYRGRTENSVSCHTQVTLEEYPMINSF